MLSLDEEGGVGAVIRDGNPAPDRRADARMALEVVTDCIRELGETCRLLLLGAAEGMRPRELTRLLGWPKEWNKKASDDLRECRKRLKKRLGLRGLTPDDLVPPDRA